LIDGPFDQLCSQGPSSAEIPTAQPVLQHPWLAGWFRVSRCTI